ncbi:unnamed protein product, partial [Nesidiocoris tenuis]
MVRLGKNAPSLPSMRLHSSPGQAYICGSPLTSVTIPIRSTSLVPVRTILASRFCRIAGLNIEYKNIMEITYPMGAQTCRLFRSTLRTEKEINREKLDEVFPKAELLKVRLLDMYKQQYERYLKDEKRKKEESAKAREQLELLKKKKEAERANALSTLRSIPAPPTEHISNLRISPVPNITGELYPNLVALDDEAKAVLVPPKPLQLCVTT